jgi:hypothetical protein
MRDGFPLDLSLLQTTAGRSREAARGPAELSLRGERETEWRTPLQTWCQCWVWTWIWRMIRKQSTDFVRTSMNTFALGIYALYTGSVQRQRQRKSDFTLRCCCSLDRTGASSGSSARPACCLAVGDRSNHAGGWVIRHLPLCRQCMYVTYGGRVSLPYDVCLFRRTRTCAPLKSNSALRHCAVARFQLLKHRRSRTRRLMMKSRTCWSLVYALCLSPREVEVVLSCALVHASSLAWLTDVCVVAAGK